MAKRKSKLYLAVLDAAKEVSPQAVREFGHDHVDLLISEAFLSGQVTVPAVAEFCETTQAVVRHRLIDPVRCAWISDRIEHLISSRLGTVMASVFARAVATGDPTAAKFLVNQYGKLRAEERRNVNVDISLDFTGFTDEELVKIAREKARKLGLAKEVVDAEFEVRDTGGEDLPAERGVRSLQGVDEGEDPDPRGDSDGRPTAGGDAGDDTP